jgi:hypothetical protein
LINLPGEPGKTVAIAFDFKSVERTVDYGNVDSRLFASKLLQNQVVGRVRKLFPQFAHEH